MYTQSKKILFTIFFACFSITLSASPLPIEEVLWGRLLPQLPIYHPSGFLAWNGVRQTDHYESSNSFYHSTGLIAWNGMKRTINTWGEASERGIVYYDVGAVAWGGIPQKLNM